MKNYILLFRTLFINFCPLIDSRAPECKIRKAEYQIEVQKF